MDHFHCGWSYKIASRRAPPACHLLSLRLWIDAGFTIIIKYEGKGPISAEVRSSLILSK